ncbi:transglutaminase-like domain-containing protein [Clostridium facile]|uniref:Transglutaminase domain-containing protein n=1 Tax=Clostridium facile TaxID=2763035 RepID=A0ABR7ISW2_9CLOT|nr:transglutaminase-like domain-containing protein [Clostridium facile]MBC5788228.1 transglutaminase domain-containing protein [Clostridium facile]PWN00162.1 MAG: hypothetical protein DBX37_02710 [Massilioclostridium sp.]
MRPSEAHKKIKFQIMSILLVSAFSVMACSLWMINTQALDTEQASTQVASILEPTKQLAKKLDKELATKIEQIKQQAAQEAAEQQAAEQAAAAQAAAEAEAAAQQAAAQQAAEQQQAAFQWNESPYSATMYLTENCNQRVEPRVSSASNGILKKGTAVQVVAKTDLNFMKLENGNFISADYLTAQAPVVSNTPSSGSSSAIGSTGYTQLDNLINGIFAQIFTPGMSDADKIKACYNYLIDHTDYARGTPMPGGFGDTSVEGSNNYVASAAYGCLTTGKGSCNRYSAAFIAMMRCLGYQANYIMGQTHYANGSMDDHVWAEVVIGGTPYIFDPQVEDNMRARGEGDGYSRYWKTYSQLAGKYVK